MAKKNDSISMEVIEKFDYLNTKENKVVAVVKWGDNEPTLDIRRCGENKDGEFYLSKGISLNYKKNIYIGKYNNGKKNDDKCCYMNLSKKTLFLGKIKATGIN